MAATFGPITIPDRAWRSGAACSALYRRDVATIPRTAQQYGGASQHRLASAVGIPQGRLSEILNGIEVETLVHDDESAHAIQATILDVLVSLGPGESDIEHTYYIDLVRGGRRRLADSGPIDGEAVPEP